MSGDFILENRGLIIDKYFIPPFTLWTGETVIIKLLNDLDSQKTKDELTAIFTGQQQHHSEQVQQPLTFVPHLFRPPLFKRMLSPFTVGHYLKQHANKQSSYYNMVYDVYPWLTPQTDISSLAGTPRKLLSVCATLSRSENIVFDLSGVDPEGADKIFSIVSEYAAAGGAAILVDFFYDQQDSCTIFIEAELI